jgi:hypothetical protein
MWTRPTAMRASSNTQKLQFPGFNWKRYFKTFFTKYDFIFWNIWFYILEYLGFMFWNLGFMFWNIWVSCSGNVIFIYFEETKNSLLNIVLTHVQRKDMMHHLECISEHNVEVIANDA